MRILTLTTDFGADDYGLGLMRGVIWSIAPHARLVDLSHAIPPQDVAAGAELLCRCTPYFPAGSIHLAVVDPGVGTARRPLALQAGAHFFVGPDNGLFDPLLQQARQHGQPILKVHLDRPQYWLPFVSAIFHGRDLFAPVAAHLANRVELQQLGSEIEPFSDST
jgi:hypothetical protein